MKILFILITTLLLSACKGDPEKPIEVQMHTATPTGQGDFVGTVTITQTADGLLFTPNLTHLPPGAHGFHLHEHPSCDAGLKDQVMTPALAAGGHFDPQVTGVHEGPLGKGHLGDLPVLEVNSAGEAKTPVLAPRLYHLTEINNTALMIHVGGDNYSDLPEALGGGGARMICGVIKQ